MKWYELGPFTVFDVETTGMSPAGDRIVELAALRVDQDGSEREFHTLINPGRSIPADVVAVHHITDAMVNDAPHFSTVGKLQNFQTVLNRSTGVLHLQFSKQR